MNNKEFAVIKVNSKQFIVSEGDTLVLDRITPKSNVEVLLVNEGEKVLIGEPIVDGVGVVLEVVEEKKDKKISVRRFKAKSRYRKNKGHRQPISIVKVKKIGKGIKNEIVLNLQEKPEKAKSTDEKVVKKAKKEDSSIAKTSANESKKTGDSTVLIKDVKEISDSMKEKLISAGFDTVEKVQNASDEELTSIKGIGQKAVDKLREIIK